MLQAGILHQEVANPCVVIQGLPWEIKGRPLAGTIRTMTKNTG